MLTKNPPPLTYMPVKPIKFFGGQPMPNQIFGITNIGMFTASRPFKLPRVTPKKPRGGIGIVPLIPRTTYNV